MGTFEPLVAAIDEALRVTVDEPSTVEIYTVNGALIGSYNVDRGVNTIKVDATGLVIVRVGGIAVKAILR